VAVICLKRRRVSYQVVIYLADCMRRAIVPGTMLLLARSGGVDFESRAVIFSPEVYGYRVDFLMH
jgi:hypothetical protein